MTPTPTPQKITPAHVPVAIVGGGPVGLASALLLHRYGIPCTVLERDREPSQHPKARGMRTRTMELFTQWGIAEQMQRAALPADANRFIYCDSLVGEEVARSPEPDASHDDVTRVGPCRVSQDSAHRVLLDTVRAFDDVTVLMGTTIVDLEQDGERVALTTAAGDQFTADFVIAADGIGSTVRRVLGVDMEGEPVLGYGQSIYWHGDLSRWTADRMCIQFLTGHRDGHPASIAPVDGRRRWVTMVMQPPSEARPEPPTPQEALDIINRAVGADVSPEIIDITTWRISSLVAQRWRVGRVFLAGDAAHSFPPTGGFGMNTGVQDVHNLVWKLSLVIRHLADDLLLDTYEQERIDIARSNAAWSVANSQRFRDIGRAIVKADQAELDRLLEEQRNHVDATDQDLAFGYSRGALVGRDSDPGLSPLRHARLGHRFPETTVVVAGEKRSSTTELADVFTLVSPEPERWAEAMDLAGATGVPLVLAEGPAAVVGGGRAALVRPDGIVGWMATTNNQPEQLTDVLRQLTGRSS